MSNDSIISSDLLSLDLLSIYTYIYNTIYSSMQLSYKWRTAVRQNKLNSRRKYGCHYDNAPAYTLLSVPCLYRKRSMLWLPQFSFSANLAPVAFPLPELKQLPERKWL